MDIQDLDNIMEVNLDSVETESKKMIAQANERKADL